MKHPRVPGFFRPVCLGLALAAFLATFDLRPAPAPQSMNFTVEGKVTRVSPGKLTLNTEGNIIFYVRYDDKTEIKRRDGSKGTDKDLRVGLKIKVGGDLTESGELVASKIDIQEDAEKRSAGARLASTKRAPN